ncbi:MAG: hypothetical protein ABFR97_00575 [Thermodesulfobacteriota bacterium]
MDSVKKIMGLVALLLHLIARGGLGLLLLGVIIGALLTPMLAQESG